MADMLTAKEMQSLLQVDRSTIYRMAESGRLPAIKIGKQWRFPADQVENWLGTQITPLSTTLPVARPMAKQETPAADKNLEQLIPQDCVQLILDSYAELLGVMLVVTDMEGNPITQISNPCGLFHAISQFPGALQKCIQSWNGLATSINLEPQYIVSHLGLLCTRGMVRVGTELTGMVVAGCVAPAKWPPSPSEIQNIAETFGVQPEIISDHVKEVYYLDKNQQEKSLQFVQRIANIIAHIVNERSSLMHRLDAIANLARM